MIMWFLVTFIVFSGGPGHQSAVFGPFQKEETCRKVLRNWRSAPDPAGMTSSLAVCVPGREPGRKA